MKLGTTVLKVLSPVLAQLPSVSLTCEAAERTVIDKRVFISFISAESFCHSRYSACMRASCMMPLPLMLFS